MYQRPSAPNTIGGVIDDSIRLYKATLRTWWLPSLLLSALSIAVAILMFTRLGTKPSPADMLALMRQPLVWAVYPVMIVVSIWLYVVMMANMSATARGEDLSIGGGFARGLRVLPTAIVTAILFLLISAVGLVLLVVPGIYVFARLQYWPVALVDAGGGGPLAALNSSWRMVQGHWWRTVTIFGVLFIMVIVLSMIISFVAGFTVAFAHLDPVSALIGVQVLSNAANFLIVPVFPAALVATYGDLKLRREGADLEARVQDLKPA